MPSTLDVAQILVNARGYRITIARPFPSQDSLQKDPHSVQDSNCRCQISRHCTHRLAVFKVLFFNYSSIQSACWRKEMFFCLTVFVTLVSCCYDTRNSEPFRAKPDTFTVYTFICGHAFYSDNSIITIYCSLRGTKISFLPNITGRLGKSRSPCNPVLRHCFRFHTSN